MNDAAAAKAEHDQDKEHKKKFVLVIDGTPYEVDEKKLSYDFIAELAYPGHAPDAQFAITYTNAAGPGGPNGTLLQGETVHIKNEGTRFHVRLANRS